MASILKKPTVTNKRGKNGFDVGRRRIFSSPCGMLLPVYDDFANPGDKYFLNSNTFIRTEALETAAFMRLKHHVDWFFVPITQLYRFWNEFFNFTQDIDTSFVDTYSGQQAKFGLPTLDIFKPFFFDHFGANGQSADTNGWTNFFAKVKASNGFIDVELRSDEMGTPFAWNFRRLFDMFGYGSASTTITRLNDTPTGAAHFSVFPMKYLAYHKIFYSHYNNSSFFHNKSKLFNVDRYFGSIIPDTVPGQSSIYLAPEILSRIHYRPYRKDIFTNIQPAPTFNQSFVNSLLPDSSFMVKDINTDSTLPESMVSSVGDVDDVRSMSGSFLSGIGEGAVGVGDIRTLFAFDKLMRITANSGSHYDEQTLAHFGFKMPQGISNEAYYLGSQQCDININEVVATASTGYKNEDGVEAAGATIGDIAGKGFASTPNQQDIHFTAPCHGLIMAISSIEPLPDYASRGCELFNRFIDPFDFYRPEFDNIGMVPLYDPFFIANQVAVQQNSDSIGGWTYRYFNLKQKFDVVNESMWDTNKSSWVGVKQSLYGNVIFDDKTVAPNFVPSLNTLFFVAPQYTNQIFLNSYPSYVNSGIAPVNGVTANYHVAMGNSGYVPDDIGFHNDFNSSNHVYSTDNFLLNMDIKAFKSSIMSVYSLPKM